MYFEEFLLVRLLLLEAVGNGDAEVPILFPESEVVGVDESVDFFLDIFGVLGYVFLREELLLFVVVDFVVLYRADRRLLGLLRVG